MAGSHPDGGPALRRSGVRAPRRHPAPRHQAREHPALRLRGGPAHRLRHRPHRGRLRDGDGRVHRIAVLQRSRGAQRASRPPRSRTSTASPPRCSRSSRVGPRSSGARARRSSPSSCGSPVSPSPICAGTACPTSCARCSNGPCPRTQETARPARRRSGTTCKRCSARPGYRWPRWRCRWGGGPRTGTSRRSRSSRTVRRSAPRTRSRSSSGRGRAPWVQARRAACRARTRPRTRPRIRRRTRGRTRGPRGPNYKDRPTGHTAATAALSGGAIDGATVYVGRPGTTGWPGTHRPRAPAGRHRPRALRPQRRRRPDGGPPRPPRSRRHRRELGTADAAPAAHARALTAVRRSPTPSPAHRPRCRRGAAGLTRRRRRRGLGQAGHRRWRRHTDRHAGGADQRVARPAAGPDPAPAGRDDRGRRHRLGHRRHHARGRIEPDGGLRPGHRHVEDGHPAARRAFPRDGRDLPRRDHRARRVGGPGRQPHGGELQQGLRAARRGLGRAAADAVAARRGRRGRRRRPDHRQRRPGQRQAQPHHRGVRRHDVEEGHRPADTPRAPGHGHRRHVRVRGGRARPVVGQEQRARWSATTRRPTRGPRSRRCPPRVAESGRRSPTGGLVVAGGEEPTSVDNSVYAYDIASNSWSDLPPLPTGRHGLALAAVDKTIFAIGGATQPSHTASTGVGEALQMPPRRLQPAPVWRAAEGRADRAPVRGHHCGGRQDVDRRRPHAGQRHRRRLRVRPGDRQLDAWP